MEFVGPFTSGIAGLNCNFNNAVYTAAPVAGDWAGAVMTWAGAVMSWARAVMSWAGAVKN